MSKDENPSPQQQVRASILEEAAQIADLAAIEARTKKDSKDAKGVGGTAVLTGYIFAETEAKSIAAEIRLLADTPPPQTNLEGSVLVPIEPTAAMLERGAASVCSLTEHGARAVYLAMIAALSDETPGEHQVVLDAIQSHNSGEEE